MGINLGKWSDAENGLLLAGATNELIMKRTGRSLYAVLSARSKMGIALGRKIKAIPEGLFLAQERAKMRELKKAKNQKPEVTSRVDVSPVEVDRHPRRIVSIDKAREEGWKPLSGGAGVVFLKNDLGTPPKKVILRENIIKHNGTLADQNKPLDPKTLHEEIGRAPFTRVEPEVLDPKLDEAITKMATHNTVSERIADTTPSKDELFFDVNGTRVTVAAGTKKVDITPYGLIIEF